MARLVAQSGSLPEGTVFDIDQGLTIGREKHNTIAMPQDRRASRDHAKVWKIAARTYSVADLGSTNGTLVNDGRVTRANLEDGDIVRVGEQTFRFELDEDEQPKAQATGPRPDLAAVLRGETEPSKAPIGDAAQSAGQIEIQERILQFSPNRRKGTVLKTDVSQTAGGLRILFMVVAVGIAVGLFLLVKGLIVDARQDDLRRQEAPVDPDDE